jgi:hypothetical protein
MKTPRNTHPKVALVPVVMALLSMTISIVRADYQSTVLSDSPLAYYPLSTNVDPTGTTATDVSGNGNTGTYIGSSPQFNNVPGPSPAIPTALQFDGASAFVDLSTGPNPGSMNFSGPITLEAWAQPANSTGFGDIFAKGYDGSSYQEIMLRVNGGYGYDYVASSGSQGVSGGQQYTNWVHVVLSSDGTTTSLYLNGTLVQSVADTSGAQNFSDPWAIGNGTSGGASRFFNGNICQVALYNHGLSSNSIVAHYYMGKYGLLPGTAVPIITNQPISQISFTNGMATFSVGLLSIYPTTNQWYKNGAPLAGQTNATLTLSNLQVSDAASYKVIAGNINGTTNSAIVSLTLQQISPYDKTVVSDSPLAYYPLDSSIDTAPFAMDLSGHGLFGLYVNMDPVSSSQPGPSPHIPNSLTFSSFSSYVDLNAATPATQLNFSGPVSMEAWVEPYDSSTFGDIVAKGYDVNTYQEVTMRVNGPYGANYYASSGSTAVSGGQQGPNWSHVVLSSDGSHCNLYINGVLIQSASDTGGSQNFADTWAIGNGTVAGCTRFFYGSICQVAIYNHGLTTNQILSHYFMGLMGTAPSNSIPIISTQPQSQSAFGGGSATFTFSFLSPLTTTNLWYKNGIPLAGQTNRTLVLNNVQSGDAANYSVVIGNNIGTTNSVAASLTVLAAGDSLVWTITNNTSIWDSGTSANWVNVSNSQQVVFNTGDKVLFDDTPGVPTYVTINGTVSPLSVTVDSTNNYFSFNGPGALVGSGSLLKEGPSTLTIVQPGGGGFSGAVTIAGGTISASNCFVGAASVTITNTSTLDFGGGTYNTGQPITVSGTGVNAQGALFNSYADYPLEVYNITMAGDTTFGGSARWDLGSGSSIKGAHNLTIDWSAGAGYGEWNTVTIATNITGISLINGSQLGLKYMDTSFQNPGTVVDVGPNGKVIFYNGGCNGSFHINTGASLAMVSDGPLTGNSIVFEDGTEWDDYSGGTDVPINNAITFNGITRIVIGNHNMLLNNVVSGAGGFISDVYDHSFVFTASNTYAGPSAMVTEIVLANNGSISHSTPIFFGGGSSNALRMDVSGRTDHTLTLASGQTLAGVGAINGSLIVSPGAILSPAGTNTGNITIGSNPTGTIMATTNITLNGTTIIKLNGTGTSDALQAGGTINYGGTLNLVDISGGGLAVGNSFQVFNAAHYSGSFTTITPATPGPNLAWDLSHLSSGQVGVVTAQPVFGSTTVSGGKLIFSGTGGTLSGTFYVLTTTNLTLPLASWTVLSTNQYDASGNFNVTNPFSTGVPQRFYMIKQ